MSDTGRRSLADIISDADALADRFEQLDPASVEAVDASPIRAVHDAFQRSADAQAELADAVAGARATGFSWAHIGSMMGVSGEAARKRFGRIEHHPPGRKRLAG